MLKLLSLLPMLGFFSLAADRGATRGAAAAAPRVTILLQKGNVAFVVADKASRLRYSWTLDDNGGGRLTAAAEGTGATPIVARYNPFWSGPARLLSSQMIRSGNGALLTQQLDVGGTRVTMTIKAFVIAGSLMLDLSVNKPLLTSWDTSIQESASIQRFSVPYNPVPIYHTKGGSVFASLFLDWNFSNATRIAEQSAEYLPRTDGTNNRAAERLVFAVSPHVADILPISGGLRSRYYDRMGGRVVVDVTTTEHFDDIERKIINLRDAGLSNCVFIVHVWQRLGYDNGLPSVLPPNGVWGGQTVLKRVGAIARSMGCEFALHQNYIDYYPNADTFDVNLVARDSRGDPIKAWFNQAVGVQSFTTKPRAFSILARPIAPEIHRTLGTTASFIDVNPSFAPWERVDMDAREKDGGSYRAFLTGSKALFTLLQDSEQGPVLGEGGQHFYWTGAVDGVEADLAKGPAGDAREEMLWVDFDLRRIHPLQQNYGMGYYERYVTGQFALSQPDRDIYRTQQIAFGHLPYHSGLDWGDPRLLVQEAALAQPVARRYANAAVARIDYRVGRAWKPIEVALPLGAGRVVRVRYANSLVVTANTGKLPIVDDKGTILPRGGWSATGAGITAQSGLADGQRRDFVRSADAIYADPRDTPGNWVSATSGMPTTNTALIDFGAIRTTAQTWIRCLKGEWTFIGFARRGFIDLAVKNTLVARPIRLSAGAGRDVSPSAVLADSFWRVRLASGRRYLSGVKCNS